MDLKRVHSILDNKEKCDIFYDDRPVWIQGVTQHLAKVGFTDNGNQTVSVNSEHLM